MDHIRNFALREKTTLVPVRHVFIVFAIILLFLSCNKPSEPVFDNVYDDQSDQYIPFADLSTNVVTQILAQSAVSGGQFANDYGKPVTQKGVCWSLVESPTVDGSCSQDGSGLSVFTSTLTGLVADTLYYVRAYATNADGTTYGQQLSFRTMDGKPVFSTPVVSGIGTRGASLSGSVSADGGAPILRRGFVWSLNSDPTTQDSVRVLGEGIGEMFIQLDSLFIDKNYYFRTFAESGTGVHFSVSSSFKTLNGSPVIGQSVISEVTSTSATISVTIDSDGGLSINTRGVCFGAEENPTTQDDCVISGSGTGRFSVNLTELIAEKEYNFRAYASNALYTIYGNNQTFTTDGITPTVSTGVVNNISRTSATVAGNVTSVGSSDVLERGVCVATSENPNLGNTCFTSGSGTGTFNTTLTGLTSGVRYYVRTFASNNAGTSYGNEVQFTTMGTTPTVTTELVSNITKTGATVAGNVISQGTATVTSRGMCYSTIRDSTTANVCVTSGSGTGAFTSTLSSLNSGVLYYVQAYATNVVGTSYGNQVEFTTIGTSPTIVTGSVSNISTTVATIGGNVISQGSSVVTSRGACYSTTQNPTTLNTCVVSGDGIGAFTSTLSGLSPGVRYYVRVYATSTVGTSYGSQLSFNTTVTGGDESGRDNRTQVVDVRNPLTGRTWMDRNLGATRAAVSSTDSNAYGNKYQWGRSTDGHQISNSATSSVVSLSDQPPDGRFIVGSGDWRSSPNNNLWQTETGLNNPCPLGFRVPTIAEWNVERLTWNSNSSTGAISSPLKLPLAGLRTSNNGSLSFLGSYGLYWSSSVSNDKSVYLYISNTVANEFGNNRAVGYSVRCIKS